MLLYRYRRKDNESYRTYIIMKPNKPAKEMTTKELAKYIDYSVLKPEFTEQEIIDLTKDGVQLGCATICINPGYMDLCEPYVKGSETMLCPVTDFPFGDSSTESRVQQIEAVAKYDTVKEVDIVANFGKIRSGKLDEVTEDLKACADAAHKYGRALKVILETDALTKEEIKAGCHCVMDSGADFIKTSTGFLTGHDNVGATPEVIQLIMDENQGKCKIKGSGCIRTREHFLKLIDMGIDRMGVGYRSVPVVLDLKK
jgi:deoxyribose-phosphate aldolase